MWAGSRFFARETLDAWRGFSLVELMAVVAVVGVLSAIALPNISTAVRRAREPAEGVRLRTFLTESRALARRTNRCVQLTFADTRVVNRTIVTSCSGTLAAVCDCSAPLLAVPVTASLTLGSAAEVTAVRGNTVAMASVPASVASGRNVLFLANGSTPYLDDAEVEVRLVESARRQIFALLAASGIVRQKVGS